MFKSSNRNINLYWDRYPLTPQHLKGIIEKSTNNMPKRDERESKLLLPKRGAPCAERVPAAGCRSVHPGTVRLKSVGLNGEIRSLSLKMDCSKCNCPSRVEPRPFASVAKGFSFAYTGLLFG